MGVRSRREHGGLVIDIAHVEGRHPLSALELARLQFGVTTVYHFLFVPMSIGLALAVAFFQTMHYRTGNPMWGRMVRFWGKLMLLSFAVGVVTGIVQEFQFGMNWSEYSRYVGDVFGAPLAVEGLAAFFLESTFIGLWIFGRNRLSPGLHLATIWAVFVGTLLSAYFILAANSWMQHPVGYEINAQTDRAEMTDFWAIMTNSTQLYAFSHTILGAVITGAMVVLGVSAYRLRRGEGDTAPFMRAIKVALPVVLVATVATSTVGHFQAQLMTVQQPMKMAAAEAHYETSTSAGFSLLAVAPFEKNPGRSSFDLQVPGVLSFLATNSFSGEVKGVNDLQREYEERFGPGDYTPVIGITYWSFRLMVGAAMAMILLSLLGMWFWRRGTLQRSRRFLLISTWAIVLPFVANSAGWIFTEMGRQPWVVQDLLATTDGVSPQVGTADVLTSLLAFTVVYGVLAAVAGWLAVRFIRSDPGTDEGRPAQGEASTDLVY